ncbi:7137_t:CDS:2 [Dentiscutata heterogama]|uniref:7137_t:CDS:1 n=1 Tax=Dentiscutata heterogama TaxID=1316150 RepID=A0ACA9K1E7_9GLOM|nr:7137_t:CDS:2 [Dentiscutata heterogama]
MQPLSPCVITSQLGFGGCGSPRLKPKSNKSSLSNFSPATASHPKSSRIVQSILSSVLQLASNTNSTVEFTKREFMNSKIDQTNKKSLLSEMLKKNVDSKDINQALHGKPIMIKKPCDLTIETNVTTTKREFGSSTDTTTTSNETNTNLTKKVLKFGNCPLVVRERSTNLNNDSSKPDVSTAEPSKAVHKRTNHHLSPVPITSPQDDDDDDDFDFECDMCDGSDSDDGYVEDDEEDEEDEEDDISEYDENNDEYDENNDLENDIENVDHHSQRTEEIVTQSNITSNDSNTLTAALPDGKAITTSTTVSTTVSTTATTIVTTTTTVTATTSSSDSPTSCHSTTSHYSTAISILTPTSTNTTSICYYKSKSLPQPKRGILVNTKPVNLRTKGIPIPLSNTNFVLGSRSHHYGSRDKFHKRKHCHRHSHHNGEKNGDITLLDSEWKKDADDILFWPMST